MLANSREPLDGAGGSGIDGDGPSDVDDLAADLVVLTRGAPPAGPGLPLAFLAELVLVAAAVGALLVAAVAVLRARGWARRRAAAAAGWPAWRFVPYAVPLLLLAVLPDLAAPVVGGATFRDLAQVWPTALVAAEVAALRDPGGGRAGPRVGAAAACGQPPYGTVSTSRLWPCGESK
ncbi:hypothetical protein BJF90_20980 [Pseudonocardia sp. CNS-004]|nr:hypothetical protein BJF90_20980 [Pseudonocardia sp. CNS-004]